MMGGDLDASSKCIAGIHIVQNDAYLLIVVSIPMLVLYMCSFCQLATVLLVHIVVFFRFVSPIFFFNNLNAAARDSDLIDFVRVHDKCSRKYFCVLESHHLNCTTTPESYRNPNDCHYWWRRWHRRKNSVHQIRPATAAALLKTHHIRYGSVRKENSATVPSWKKSLQINHFFKWMRSKLIICIKMCYYKLFC